ncbi:hypothetical protein [Streptomyces natalensis]|nr:hypothetical protein [Streptomyces natalensis]
MRSALRTAAAIVLLGLAAASCPAHHPAPKPNPTTQKGIPAWP